MHQHTSSLMDIHGKPKFGYFDQAVTSLGVEQFEYLNEMDKPVSKLRKHFSFKQFQFISLVSSEWVIGIALADIRYVGSGFCYLYNVKTNELQEYSWLKPLGIGYQLASSPFCGEALVQSSDFKVQISIVNGLWHILLNHPDIVADLQLQPLYPDEPLAMCTPTGYSGWTYTQKHNALNIAGSLIINGVSQDVKSFLGGYDFSAGFMRRETSWRWASINGLVGDERLGLNLAAGVNETGSLENILWVNGQRHLLPAVHFQFERMSAVPSCWRIYSDDGRVELIFNSRNCRSEKLNLGFLKSNFRQYIGSFSGHLIAADGREFQLHEQLGLTEDHFAKW